MAYHQTGNDLHCEAIGDRPTTGGFVGQIAWVNSPFAVYRWNGSSWVDVTPAFAGLPSAVDPASLNPYFYLRADSFVGADGALVGTWEDSSANNRDFTASGGLRPTYKTNIINGKPVMRFSGANCMQRASVGIGTFTIIIAFRGEGTPGILYELGADVGLNDGLALYGTSGTTLNCKKGGVMSSRNFDANWSVQDVWGIVAHRYCGSHETHNGIINVTYSAFPPSISNGDPGSGTTTATFFLGARNAASLGFTGDIFTIAAYTPTLTREQTIGACQFIQRELDL